MSISNICTYDPALPWLRSCHEVIRHLGSLASMCEDEYFSCAANAGHITQAADSEEPTQSVVGDRVG